MKMNVQKFPTSVKDKLNCKVGKEGPYYFSCSLYACLPPVLSSPYILSGLHPSPGFSSAMHQTNLNSPPSFLFHPGLTLQNLLVLMGFIRPLLSVKSVIISSNSRRRNHNVTMKTIASVEYIVLLCSRHSSSILHSVLHLILIFTEDER